MPAPVCISDGNQIAQVDKVSGGLLAIAHEHHEIHEGDSYRAHVTANVGSGNTLSLTITTPAAPKLCHLVIHVETGNSANVSFYEGVTVTANTGNTVTAFNANRTCPDGTTVVKSQATLNTTNCPVLFSIFTGQPGATPANEDTGGTTRHEWILKPATSYSVVVTETGAAAQLMHISFDWYEHIPGEVD